MMKNNKLLAAVLVLMLAIVLAAAACAETTFSFLDNASWSMDAEEIASTLNAKPYKFKAAKGYVEQDGQILLSSGKLLKMDIRWVSLMNDDSGKLESIAIYSAKGAKAYKALVGALDKDLGKHETKTLTRVTDGGEEEYEVEIPVAYWANEDTEAYLYGTTFAKIDSVAKGKDAFIIVINRPGVNMTQFTDRSDEFRQHDEEDKPMDTWSTTYTGSESADMDSLFSTSGTGSFKTAEEKEADEEKEAYKQQWIAGQTDTARVFLRGCTPSFKSSNVLNLGLTIQNLFKDETITSVTVEMQFLNKEANFVPAFGVMEKLTATYDVKIKPGKSAKQNFLAYGTEGANMVIASVSSYTTSEGRTVDIPENERKVLYKVKRKK